MSEEKVTKGNLPNFLFAVKSCRHIGELPYADSTENCIYRNFYEIPLRPEFRMSYNFLKPQPYLWESSNSWISVFGRPIIKGRMDCKALCMELDGTIDDILLQRIDGEFLIIKLDKRNGFFYIISDRFNSHPFYYHISSRKHLTASFYFSNIWSYLKRTDQLSIHSESFFEFFWFRRLLGSKTFDRNTRFLPDASILSFQPGGSPKLHRYWKRDYTKTKRSLRANAEMTAELLTESMDIKSGDDCSKGLFLNCDISSRILLDLLRGQDPVCFTAGFKNDSLLKAAEELAESHKCRTMVLNLSQNIFSDIISSAVYLGGGMYNYENSILMPFGDTVGENAEVCFHGHGLNYMFQGKYISDEIFEKSCEFRRKTASGGGHKMQNLTHYFINNAPYMSSGTDLFSFVENSKIDELSEFLNRSVESVFALAEDHSQNLVDIWEYMNFHHVSRHFSFNKHATVSIYSEQRITSFYNKLFDLFLSIPEEQRYRGKLHYEVFRIIESKLPSDMRNAKKIIYGKSCRYKRGSDLADSVAKNIFPFLRENFDIQKSDKQSFRDSLLRNDQKIRNHLNDIFDSGVLETLDFLDIEKIKKQSNEWFDNKSELDLNGDFIQALLTVGTFLLQ